MPSDDYFTATDLEAIRMESELVTLENAFLKGRIMSLEQDLRAAREREAQVRRALERLRAPAQPDQH